MTHLLKSLVMVTATIAFFVGIYGALLPYLISSKTYEFPILGVIVGVLGLWLGALLVRSTYRTIFVKKEISK